MATGINIQGPNTKVTKESAKALTNGIIKILEAGHQYRADQETIRLALTQLGKLGTAQGNTISNSSISDVR